MGANALLRAADGLPWLFPSPQDVQEDQPQPPQNTPLPDGPVAATSTPQPVPAAGSQAEKAVPNKSLLDWLRQQSDYTLDVPGFGTVRVAFGGVCVSLSALSVAFSAVFLVFFCGCSRVQGFHGVSQNLPSFPAPWLVVFVKAVSRFWEVGMVHCAATKASC